jgi:hypothetical protein
MTRYERLAKAAIDAVKRFENNYEDCTCSDDPEGTCWYHLSDEEQTRWRIEYVAEMLEYEELEMADEQS